MPTPFSEHDPGAVKAYLASFDLFGDNPAEGRAYLEHALRRFMLTLALTPPAASADSRLLELGANPYFLTLLLRRFCRYHLTLANFFGAGHVPTGQGCQTLTSTTYQERHEFTYDHFNLETDRFPYPARTFELVLCCEILEHCTIDPSHALSEIHRVLTPGGHLLLTTPNVLACQNVLNLAIGRNIYDRYSGYGAYGRHNREYTPQEVTDLLQACGFDIVTLRIEDLYRHRRLLVRMLKRLRPQWRDNHFVLARAAAAGQPAYPAWLYRGRKENAARTSS
jgi:SAM-dependent methyltransferase